MEKIKAFVQTKLGVGIISLLVGVGLGAAAMDTSDLEDELSKTKSEKI